MFMNYSNLDEIRAIEDSFLKELFFYDYARSQMQSLNEIQKNVLQEEYLKIRNNNKNSVDSEQKYKNAFKLQAEIKQKLRQKQYEETIKKYEIKITCDKINGKGHVDSHIRKLNKKLKEQLQSIYNQLNITERKVIKIENLYNNAISWNEATYIIHYV